MKRDVKTSRFCSFRKLNLWDISWLFYEYSYSSVIDFTYFTAMKLGMVQSMIQRKKYW